jgi:hypothetical protein
MTIGKREKADKKLKGVHSYVATLITAHIKRGFPSLSHKDYAPLKNRMNYTRLNEAGENCDKCQRRLFLSFNRGKPFSFSWKLL